MLCQTAAVSRSGYYKWLAQNGKPAKDHNDYLLIKDVFEKGKKKLGWRGVQMNLKNKHQIVMNHKKIRRIMNKYGLRCQVRRRNPYKAIMKKTQEHRTFANLLDRSFKQSVPDKVLCTDITYLYYGAGRLAYLSAIKDIATGETLSWEVSQNISMGFVLATIEKLRGRNLPVGTLIHSDQGSHYTSPEYSALVAKLGITQSMSRKGNCIDNASMESFFGHFKDELEIKACRTFEELTNQINQYMHYYNNERYQWGLNKMTPVQYRSHLAVAIAT